MSKQSELITSGCVVIVVAVLFKLPLMMLLSAGIGMLAWAVVGEYIGESYSIGAGVVTGALAFPLVFSIFKRTNKKQREAFEKLVDEAKKEAEEEQNEH